MDAIDQLVLAWNVSTPLIGWRTVDQPGAVSAIADRLKGETLDDQPAGVVILQHDLARGLTAVSAAGAGALTALVPDTGGGSDEFSAVTPTPGQAPGEALALVDGLPDRAVVIFHNAQYLLTDLATRQAIANAREQCKVHGHLLVLLAPSFDLPPELVQDILMIDDPLPTPDQLRACITTVFEANNITLSDTDSAAATDALLGLSLFPAEGAAAMSLAATGGVDLDLLRARKQLMVNQTRGLQWIGTSETFADVAGLDAIETFSRLLMDGRDRPAVICWCDELEKMLPNQSGTQEGSGVGKDQLGVLLREMEDHGWPGILGVGPPGSGKSLYAKALAGTYTLPLLQLDFGAAKGGLVGQSEQFIREMMRVLYAIAGPRALFVATCNRLDSVPAELRRRFSYGTWFFDLPTAAERPAIWTIHRAKFEIAGGDEVPNDHDWTGADIKTCCQLAYRLRLSLQEAAEYIVPVAQADAKAIATVRQLADGTFKSANHRGTYTIEKAAAPPRGRKVYPALPGPGDN